MLPYIVDIQAARSNSDTKFYVKKMKVKIFEIYDAIHNKPKKIRTH